jgi:hypothetical protein
MVKNRPKWVKIGQNMGKWTRKGEKWTQKVEKWLEKVEKKVGK